MNARTIDVLGLRARVLEERGAGHGDPVLLVHGVGGWAETFRDVMRPLAATGRAVVAIDLPGFGESEAPRSRVRYYGPEDAFYPRFVLAAMDELGMERAHLIGNSLGGAVTYMAAVTAPERARSLVLVAAGGIGLDIAFFLRACALPGFGLLARLPRSRRAARAVLATCFFDPARITATLYEEAERYGNASFPEFVRALAAGVTIRGVRRDLRDAWVRRARDYAGPTLVVWGREDRVLPVSHVDAIKGVLPHAEVRLIERCGHLPMAECPDAFLDAVLPFLERAEAAVAA
jgi:pimeloyl-ACP methyl ester carboxylesterase